jgi:uncharacterized protein
MNCPACSREMKVLTISEVDFDVCDGGCGGIWFDWFEFEKVDEINESAGEELLHIARNPKVQVDESSRRDCPKCSDLVLQRKFHSVKRRVEIDECAGCGGIFLDAGELAEIRSLFSSDAERQEAAKAYFGDIFKTEMAPAIQEQKETQEVLEKRMRILKFICPSIWLGLLED